MWPDRVVCLALVLLGNVAAADAATLQLAAIADTFVNDEEPTMNFGALSFAEVGVLGLPKSDIERALLSFDLSGIPSGTVFASARLRLLITDAFPDPPGFSATVALLATGFDESTVTWDTQPASLPAPTATASIDAPIGGTMEIDVTALIRAQLAGANPDAVSLRIAKTDESAGVDGMFFDLATKEAMPPQPAVLVIEFSRPAPALSAGGLPLVLVVLAAVAALALRRRVAA
jgi:hypothetical protein